MKMVSWNVNGIRAAERKGFLEWLDTSGADLVFVQETKADPSQLSKNLREPEGWGAAFHSGEKRGYSGVGAFFRHQPDAVVGGLGIEEFDREGRVIMVRYGDLCVFGNYFPNGGKGVDRVDFKLRFYDQLLKRMNELRREGCDVVVCGDYNTAHEDIDLARPKANSTVSGYLPEERAWLDRYFADGWVDTFRHLHAGEAERYSWWNLRTRARDRNVGWRIDYFLVDEAARDRIVDADIKDQVEGSDHAPVTLDLTLRPGDEPSGGPAQKQASLF